MKRDIRLYYYDHGSIVKWGRLKTRSYHQHFFSSLEEAEDFVRKALFVHSGWAKHTSKKTFVVVEYYHDRPLKNSDIIALINKDKTVYL